VKREQGGGRPTGKKVKPQYPLERGVRVKISLEGEGGGSRGKKNGGTEET